VEKLRVGTDNVRAKPFIVTAAAAIALGVMCMTAGSPIAAAAPPGFPDVNGFSAFTLVCLVIYVVGQSLRRRGRDLTFIDPGYPDSMPGGAGKGGYQTTGFGGPA
jgi:hypothetical protein